MIVLSPLGGVGAQFLDNNGRVLSGGKLHVYEAGTTTPAVTYTDDGGNTAHSNPIILDSAGRIPGGQVWVDSAVSLKFVITTSADVTMVTWDNVSIPVEASFTGDSGTFSGTLHSDGDLSVGDDKFTVDSETGNVTTPGAVNAGSVTTPGAVSAGSVTTPGAVSAGSVTTPGAVSAGSVTTAYAHMTADSNGHGAKVDGYLFNQCVPRAWLSVRSDGFADQTVNCTVARLDVGVYEITMHGDNVFTSDGGAMVSCNEGYPPRVVSVKRTSDTVYLVQVYTLGAALVDSAFTFVAFGF